MRFHQQAGGSSLLNRGDIDSLQDAGVTMATVSGGQAEIRIINFGTISGQDGSIIGSVNGDFVRNSGQLFGDVDLGDGGDTFNQTYGLIEGEVRMGAGDDRFMGNVSVAEIVDGGEGRDIADFRSGDGVAIALDNFFDADGAARGDLYENFESLYGSRSGDDILRGNDESNYLQGFGGDDQIDGQGSNDFIRGGLGEDLLTGGSGNDNFVYFEINERGDTITDFSSSAAGNNDRVSVSASFGGGLTVGQLSAQEFRIRADNVAQDSDDRFIFRTTDETLWFNVDGVGGSGPVMIADMQAGATMTNLDIFII